MTFSSNFSRFNPSRLFRRHATESAPPSARSTSLPAKTSGEKYRLPRQLFARSEDKGSKARVEEKYGKKHGSDRVNAKRSYFAFYEKHELGKNGNKLSAEKAAVRKAEKEGREFKLLAIDEFAKNTRYQIDEFAKAFVLDMTNTQEPTIGYFINEEEKLRKSPTFSKNDRNYIALLDGLARRFQTIQVDPFGVYQSSSYLPTKRPDSKSAAAQSENLHAKGKNIVDATTSDFLSEQVDSDVDDPETRSILEQLALQSEAQHPTISLEDAFRREGRSEAPAKALFEQEPYGVHSDDEITSEPDDTKPPVNVPEIEISQQDGRASSAKPENQRPESERPVAARKNVFKAGVGRAYGGFKNLPTSFRRFVKSNSTPISQPPRTVATPVQMEVVTQSPQRSTKFDELREVLTERIAQFQESKKLIEEFTTNAPRKVTGPVVDRWNAAHESIEKLGEVASRYLAKSLENPTAPKTDGDYKTLTEAMSKLGDMEETSKALVDHLHENNLIDAVDFTYFTALKNKNDCVNLYMREMRSGSLSPQSLIKMKYDELLNNMAIAGLRRGDHATVYAASASNAPPSDQGLVNAELAITLTTVSRLAEEITNDLIGDSRSLWPIQELSISEEETHPVDGHETAAPTGSVPAVHTTAPDVALAAEAAPTEKATVEPGTNVEAISSPIASRKSAIEKEYRRHFNEGGEFELKFGSAFEKTGRAIQLFKDRTAVWNAIESSMPFGAMSIEANANPDNVQRTFARVEHQLQNLSVLEKQIDVELQRPKKPQIPAAKIEQADKQDVDVTRSPRTAVKDGGAVRKAAERTAVIENAQLLANKHMRLAAVARSLSKKTVGNSQLRDVVGQLDALNAQVEKARRGVSGGRALVVGGNASADGAFKNLSATLKEGNSKFDTLTEDISSLIRDRIKENTADVRSYSETLADLMKQIPSAANEKQEQIVAEIAQSATTFQSKLDECDRIVDMAAIGGAEQSSTEILGLEDIDDCEHLHDRLNMLEKIRASLQDDVVELRQRIERLNTKPSDSVSLDPPRAAAAAPIVNVVAAAAPSAMAAFFSTVDAAIEQTKSAERAFQQYRISADPAADRASAKAKCEALVEAMNAVFMQPDPRLSIVPVAEPAIETLSNKGLPALLPLPLQVDPNSQRHKSAAVNDALVTPAAMPASVTQMQQQLIALLNNQRETNERVDALRMQVEALSRLVMTPKTDDVAA